MEEEVVQITPEVTTSEVKETPEQQQERVQGCAKEVMEVLAKWNCFVGAEAMIKTK